MGITSDDITKTKSVYDIIFPRNLDNFIRMKIIARTLTSCGYTISARMFYIPFWRGLWVLKNRLKSVVRELEIRLCNQLKIREESAKLES